MGDPAEVVPGLQVCIQHFQWEGSQGSLNQQKRVMKRAGETFFSGAASPATKIVAGKRFVYSSLGGCSVHLYCRLLQSREEFAGAIPVT